MKVDGDTIAETEVEAWEWRKTETDDTHPTRPRLPVPRRMPTAEKDVVDDQEAAKGVCHIF